MATFARPLASPNGLAIGAICRDESQTTIYLNLFPDIIPPESYSLLRKRVRKPYEATSYVISFCYFILDYAYPPIFLIVGLSPYNPVNTIAQKLFAPKKIFFSALIWIVAGLDTFIGLMMTSSVVAICILIIIYGTVTLYLWTLFITPLKDGNGVELDFKVAIKVHADCE